MTKLRISENLTLDLLRLVDSRMLIQANSGGGKSWMMRVLAEQAAGHVQTIILDPEGEFATLREKFDFLLVGSGGEIPCEVRSAALLARKLLELQASAVIDMLDLVLADRRRFVRVFLEALMHLPKQLWRPLLVFIDEAHVFCPESGHAESEDAVINLMSQGRKRSYCGILATQRISKLHKDAAAEARNKLIGLATLDLDLKRAADELGLGRDRWAELRQLDPGEFFGFGPALPQKGVVRFQSLPVQTTHPKPGQRHKLTPPKPSEAVKMIAADLAELPQQAEAEIRDLDGAKRKIRELEQQLRQRPKEQVTETKIEYVEVPVLKNGQLAKTEKAADRAESLGQRFLDEAAELRRVIALAFAKAASAPPPRPKPTPIHKPAPAKPQPVRQPVPVGESAPGSLTGPEQRILDGLAELEALGIGQPERAQVALLAHYTNTNSKGFVNAMGSLRTAGLIDYPNAGAVALTDSGRQAAQAADVPRSSGEIQRRIVSLLGGAHARILEPLIAAYPNEMTREEVASAAGYTNTNSKGFVNAIGRLRSLGLVEYPGTGRVRARSILFLE